jgi:hypothetical protein
MPKTIAPQALIDEAKQADLLFRECWTGLRFHERELGRACKWIQEKELHKYIPKPNSKIGFLTFDSYIANRTGGECSRSKYYECIQIYELTQGAIALPPEMVDSMPRKNQLQLSRVIKNLPPEKKTKKHVTKIAEKAQTQAVNLFRVTAQEAMNEDLPPEKQKSPLVRWSAMLDPRVAEKLNETIEDFKLLKGVVQDGDRLIDLTSKAVMAICCAAESFAGEILKQAREKAQREAPQLFETKHETSEADATEETIYEAPDASQRIGLALDEQRVVHRKSEARN